MCREEAGASTPQAASTITVAGTERCDDDNVHDATLATDPLADPAEAMKVLTARLEAICAEHYAQGAPASYQHPCWVDKEPCSVVAAIEGSVVRALSDYYADPEASNAERGPSPFEIGNGLHFYLACDKCPRPAQAHLTELVGLRLGAHERRLLLAAPLPSQQPALLRPLRCDRSGYEAHQRARRSLERASLLHWYPAGHYGYPAADADILSRLSPLGAAVVEVCRPQLETGGRIRWDRCRSAIEQAVARYVCDPVEATRARMASYASNPRQHHYPAVTRYLLPALEEASS